MSAEAYAVLWNDAHVNALDECDAGDTVHRPWKYTSVGILVRSNEAGVTLAMDQGEDGKYRTRSFIPREMITDEFSLGPMKRRRQKRAQSRSSQTIPAGDVSEVRESDRSEGR